MKPPSSVSHLQECALVGVRLPLTSEQIRSQAAQPPPKRLRNVVKPPWVHFHAPFSLCYRLNLRTRTPVRTLEALGGGGGLYLP